MKFLLITRRFHTNLYFPMIALQNAGHTVKVLVLYKGQSEFYENIDIEIIKQATISKIVLKIIRLFKKNYLKTQLELRLQYPSGKELKREIKKFKPDVIMLKAYQDSLAIKTLLVAKKFRIKVLMLTQTPFAHIKGSKFLFGLNIKLFRHLKVHAYITAVEKNYTVFKDFGIDNVYYLPFVFPANKNERIKNLNPNEPIKLMSVGKFVKRKAHLLLIKAIEQLLKKGLNINLDIYGEKADNECYNKVKEYVNTHNLREYISLNSNIEYKKIIKEYQQHDIFVLPSYKEPAAYSPVEAMAHALPVICSTENGTKYYIEEGKNGYVFEANNLDDLKLKIQRIIDTDNLHLFSKHALQTAIENHNLESFAKRIEDIVTTIKQQ